MRSHGGENGRVDLTAVDVRTLARARVMVSWNRDRAELGLPPQAPPQPWAKAGDGRSQFLVDSAAVTAVAAGEWLDGPVAGALDAAADVLSNYPGTVAAVAAAVPGVIKMKQVYDQHRGKAQSATVDGLPDPAALAEQLIEQNGGQLLGANLTVKALDSELARRPEIHALAAKFDIRSSGQRGAMELLAVEAAAEGLGLHEPARAALREAVMPDTAVGAAANFGASRADAGRSLG